MINSVLQDSHLILGSVTQNFQSTANECYFMKLFLFFFFLFFSIISDSWIMPFYAKTTDTHTDDWTCTTPMWCWNSQCRDSPHSDFTRSALGHQLTEWVFLLCWLMPRQSIKGRVCGKRVSVRPNYMRATLMDCLGATVGPSHFSVRPNVRLPEPANDVSNRHHSLRRTLCAQTYKIQSCCIVCFASSMYDRGIMSPRLLMNYD